MLAVTCLALTIYYEARDQPLDGQLVVAEVVLNRVESEHYPDDVCSVVYQPKQFSFTHDGKPERPKNKVVWKETKRLARKILDNPDEWLLHSGSTHYHATYVQPYWSNELVLVGRIGDHIFYTEKNDG